MMMDLLASKQMLHLSTRAFVKWTQSTHTWLDNGPHQLLPGMNKHAWGWEPHRVTFSHSSSHFRLWIIVFKKKKKETPFALLVPLVLVAVRHSHLFLAAVHVDPNQNTQTVGAVASITHRLGDSTASPAAAYLIGKTRSRGFFLFCFVLNPES